MPLAIVSDELTQERMKACDYTEVDDVREEMCDRKLPLRRWIQQPERNSQHPRVQRVPVSTDRCIPVAASIGAGDIDVRNAIDVHEVAGGPGLTEAQSRREHDGARQHFLSCVAPVFSGQRGAYDSNRGGESSVFKLTFLAPSPHVSAARIDHASLWELHTAPCQ